MEQIIIPTYRRPAPEQQHTWAAIPGSWRGKTTFVVDQQDYDAMKHVEHFSKASFIVVPTTVATIADKRAWLLRTLEYERIIMFDDDLKFSHRISETDTGLRQAEEADMDEALWLTFELLKDFAHMGWSCRQGNNRLPSPWAHNTRMTYVLGYQTKTVRENCELGRIQTREDMDYTLQLLKLGYENRVYSQICADQKYNAPGGASEERTMERSNADAEKLAELHPGLVRVVEKQYSVSVPRKEVVCSWKKALKHAGSQRQPG